MVVHRNLHRTAIQHSTYDIDFIQHNKVLLIKKCGSEPIASSQKRLGPRERERPLFTRQSRTGPNNSSNQALSSRKSLTLSSLSKAKRICRYAVRIYGEKVIRVYFLKTNFYRGLRHFISSAYQTIRVNSFLFGTNVTY